MLNMEEYIDIVDEHGNRTGEAKTKAEIHKNGHRHRTVHVWLLNENGQLLIQRRSSTVIYPNLWDISSAGHISAGETPLQAAMRELREELGLIVAREDIGHLFVIRGIRNVLKNGTYINHEINDVYLVRIKGMPILKLQDEEVAEVKWVPWRELERIVESNDPAFVRHTEEYRKLFAELRKLKVV